MNAQNPANTQTGTPSSDPASVAKVILPSAKNMVKNGPASAVVRPSKKLDGTAVRFDGAEMKKVRAPHLRTHQLEDYVKWLKEQAAEKNLKPAAPIQPQVELTSLKHQRSDEAHAEAGARRAAPSPNVPAKNFNFDADLERILAKLDMPRISPPAKQQPKSANISPQIQVADPTQTNPSTAAAGKINSEEIIRTVSQAIASVLTDHSESEIEQKIRLQLENSKNPAVPPASDRDAKKTALPQHTSPVEPTPSPGEFKDNIAPSTVETLESDQFGVASTQAAGPDSKHSAATDEAVDMGRLLAGPITENENPQPSSSQSTTEQHSPEIPISVAAWDVDEFRWPIITNHMVTEGAAAIEELAKTALRSLAPGQQRLAVTSPGRGEGTTSIAISLARCVAANGGKVLLVDADLGNAGLSSNVGLGPNISWVNALGDCLPTAEVIIRSQRSQLCIMPLAPLISKTSGPRFIFDQLGELTRQIQSNFDLLIFDIGPASQLTAELSQPNGLVDAGLLVHNGLSTARFMETQQRLLNFGLSNMVVAQNSVQQPAANVA